MGLASDFVLIVVAGLLGGIAARAIRLPLLVGYVAAGVLVGPHTTGPTVGQIEEIELLAEIGVALLLFSLGLEISLADLKPVRGVALIGGSIQILLTTAIGTFAGTALLGIPKTEAIWLGAMVSLSSTMVVLKMLSASGATSSLASRVLIGLLVVQDLAVIPMLVILPQLGDVQSALPNVASAVAFAAAFLAAVVVLGTRLLPWLLKRLLRWGSRELFLVAVVAIGVGLGQVTHAAGLSFALGAFVAGIILSESEFSHQALSDVVPLRDIFGLLFFVTVGMLLDPAYVLANAGRISVMVILIFCVKSLVTGSITRAFGYVNMAPWIVGLGLAQIGEFSFVLARNGLSSGAISKPVYDLVLSCTVLTMALSPLVASAAFPLGRAWQARQKRKAPVRAIPKPPEPVSAHVVVGGYGRGGRAAVQALQEAGIPLVLVESDYTILREAGSSVPSVWGDITREEILRAAYIGRARILLLTMPDPSSIHLAVRQALRLNPKLSVIARASRTRHVTELWKAGVESAVQPEFEGGVEMVRQALLRYNFDMATTEGLIEALRSDFYSQDGIKPT